MSGEKKAPTSLLGVMLETDESERICYGCAYAFTVQAAFTVLGNAIARTADKMRRDNLTGEERDALMEEMQDAHRIAEEYRAQFRAQRLAMTEHLQSKKQIQAAPLPAHSAARH